MELPPPPPLQDIDPEQELFLFQNKSLHVRLTLSTGDRSSFANLGLAKFLFRSIQIRQSLS